MKMKAHGEEPRVERQRKINKSYGPVEMCRELYDR